MEIKIEKHIAFQEDSTNNDWNTTRSKSTLSQVKAGIKERNNVLKSKLKNCKFRSSDQFLIAHNRAPVEPVSKNVN